MIILNPEISLTDFFDQLAESEKSMLILDYDGTLAPFSSDPNLAKPYLGVFYRINRLMEIGKTKIVIISGREIESLTKLLPKPFPELWGSHGGERLKINSKHPISIPIDFEVQQILEIAVKKAKELSPELLSEVKPLSVALHWRGKDPTQAESVKASWNELSLDHPLEIHSFDGGIELRLEGITKGHAVETLLEENPENSLIAYLGDDFTDEQAFQKLQKRALKILVRKEFRPTLADICIKPPEELLEFLDKWLEAIQ